MVTLSFTIFSGQKNYNRAHMLFKVLCGLEPIFYTTHPNEEPKNMSHSLCHRAVRFVISKDDRLWSDNTHWTLAYILEKGVDALVLDVPMYIVDFRESYPVIYDKDGVVFDSIYDIKCAIASAKRIQERLDLGWRPPELSYTIKQLYKDILDIINKGV